MSKTMLVGSCLVVALVGCMPVARMPPAYFAETAHTLAPGEVAVTGVVGGGFDLGGTATAASGRVRVGVGDHQEVGVEGSVVNVSEQVDQGFDGSPSTYIDSRGYAGKLSWKNALNDHVAVVLGAGAASTERTGGSDTSTTAFRGTSLAADAGVVASGRQRRGIVPYGGVRLSLTTPLTDPLATGTTTAAALTLSGGLSFELAPQLHAFLEGGANYTLEHSTDDDATATFGESALSAGPYGLLGLGATFGK